VQHCDDFTLRELAWRARALREERWNHTAWIAFHAAAPHAKVTLDDCHPLRQAEAKARAGPPEPGRSQLPKKLTEEQKDQQWREWKRAQRRRDQDAGRK